jgi:hypothetical protein
MLFGSSCNARHSEMLKDIGGTSIFLCNMEVPSMLDNPEE